MDITTTAEAGAEDSRPLETRSARGRPAAPAVHTRAPSAADIATEVARQGQEIGQIRATVTRSAAQQKLQSLKMRAQTALRSDVDRRDRLARRGRGDVVINDSIRRSNAAIDDADRRSTEEIRRENAQLRQRLARPQIDVRGRSEASQRSQVQRLHRAATMHYLRTGETTFNGHSLSQLERQAAPQARTMFGGAGPDGGFLILPENDTGPIEKLLKEFVPMRQVADVKTINAYTYKKPVRVSTPGASWGPELASAGTAATPKYELLDFPAHNLYADPAVSQDLLEDSQYNIEQEIADGCLEDFSVAEAVAFISGDGVEKPYGFLGYAASKYVANASWEWGKIGFKTTGASGAFPTPTTSVGSADPIIALQYDLKAAYRQMAKWMMNRLTIGTCRQLKDVEGRYIWSEANVITGTPATLDGREVVEAEQMPTIAADAFAIALADWTKFFLIVDRVGMMVKRDDLTAYPQIRFRTRKRVGGGVKNYEAGKLLKFA